MKITEVRQQTDVELQKLLAKERQALAEGVVDLRTKDVKQVRQLRGIKKTIAKILTVLSERRLASTGEDQ